MGWIVEHKHWHAVDWLLVCQKFIYPRSGVRRKFSWGFHSVAHGGHLHVVCAVCDVTIWCHIHVSKPRFGEVCWYNMHILLHALLLIYVSMH